MHSGSWPSSSSGTLSRREDPVHPWDLLLLGLHGRLEPDRMDGAWSKNPLCPCNSKTWRVVDEVEENCKSDDGWTRGRPARNLAAKTWTHALKHMRCSQAVGGLLVARLAGFSCNGRFVGLMQDCLYSAYKHGNRSNIVCTDHVCLYSRLGKRRGNTGSHGTATMLVCCVENKNSPDLAKSHKQC